MMTISSYLKLKVIQFHSTISALKAGPAGQKSNMKPPLKKIIIKSKVMDVFCFGVILSTRVLGQCIVTGN